MRPLPPGKVIIARVYKSRPGYRQYNQHWYQLFQVSASAANLQQKFPRGL
jgi:hypothetical protein